MKATIKHSEASQPMQVKANKQASVSNVLQAYKDKTVQLKTAIKYDPQVVKIGEEEEIIGQSMEAYLDPDDPIKGTITNSHEIPLIMNYLNTKYPNRSRGWHRGHLLNAKLGGLNIPINLVPLPNSLNTAAHKIIEENVKRIVGIGVPCSYSVAYSFNEDPENKKIGIGLHITHRPNPRSDYEKSELQRRDGVNGGSHSLTTTITDVEDIDRPSSPQPSRIEDLEGNGIFVGEHHSGFQDTRIAGKGWGILKNDSGNDIALNVDQQNELMELYRQSGRMTHDSLMQSDAYKTLFYGHEDNYLIRLSIEKEKIRNEAIDILYGELEKFYNQTYQNYLGEGEYDLSLHDSLMDMILSAIREVPQWEDYELPESELGLHQFKQELKLVIVAIYNKYTQNK